MKQLILITILLLSIVSCKKENLQPSTSDINGIYTGNCTVDTSKQCNSDFVYSSSINWEVTPYIATQLISNITVSNFKNNIEIELTNCSFGNYSINLVPNNLEAKFTNGLINTTTWIIGTENHSIINGTIKLNSSNQLVIEYYERIKKTNPYYYFRHYKGTYTKN